MGKQFQAGRRRRQHFRAEDAVACAGKTSASPGSSDWLFDFQQITPSGLQAPLLEREAIQAHLLCCASLYCLQIPCFLQIQDLWQPCVKQVCPHHFPTGSGDGWHFLAIKYVLIRSDHCFFRHHATAHAIHDRTV